MDRMIGERAAEPEAALARRSEKGRRPVVVVQWERFGWSMVGPSMLFLIAMAAFPLLSIVIMSTFRIDLTAPFDNGWVGLENYRDILKDARFWNSIRLTAIYTVSTVVLQVAIGLAL